MTIEKKERHITEDDIFNSFVSMQLIVIKPRYSNSKFAAVIGSTQSTFPEMVDALTSGDQDYIVVDSLFTGTPWYPYGEGETIQEAIDSAIDRLNTIEPEYKREALALIHNSYNGWARDRYNPMEPLVLTGEVY